MPKITDMTREVDSRLLSNRRGQCIKYINRYNKKHGSHFTYDDYLKYATSNDGKINTSVNFNFRPPQKNKSLVLPISDTHIGKLCKIPRTDLSPTGRPLPDVVAYDTNIFLQSHDRYKKALESLAYDFKLTKVIDEVVIISLGDLIDGDGRIYKTQPFNLQPEFDRPQAQKLFCVNDFLVPFMDWAESTFDCKVRMHMCAGNHDAPGYDISDYNNMTYDMANSLQLKGYEVTCQEAYMWYGLVDVKGWGFLCTHGHGPRIGNCVPTIKRNLMEKKMYFPNWQFYLEGHWHNSNYSGNFIHAKGKNSIYYYRSASTIPNGADRHGSKFMGGDNHWFVMTIDQDEGLIDEKMFDVSRLS